jgi:hypothetical protein
LVASFEEENETEHSKRTEFPCFHIHDSQPSATGTYPSYQRVSFSDVDNHL